MKKILVVSDIHECVGDVLDYLKKDDYNAILSCGDTAEYVEWPIPFYTIIGNHENFDKLEEIESGKLKIENFNYLKTGKLLELFGIRIIGFGGNYSPVRYFKSRKSNPTLFLGGKRRHYNFEDFDACKSHQNIDILLAHETCLEMEMEARGHKVGRPEISDLIKLLKPKYFFSGHHHHLVEKEFDGVHGISLPYPSDAAHCLIIENGKIYNHWV
jgi:hypothetical protein